MELVPISVVQALQTVAGLQRWRTDAPKPDGIDPVPVSHVEAVLSSLSRPVAAMVRIQLFTGCRTEEVMRMRRCEPTIQQGNWEYRPASHKNGWRGLGRIIVLGPKAMEALRPILGADPSAFVFSPRDAVRERHSDRTRRRRSKPTPPELARRGKNLGARPNDRYSRRSDRLAIVRECDRAGVPRWTPLPLRHTAATEIRRCYGLEAAQVILGHARSTTTERYAEVDMGRAHEVMTHLSRTPPKGSSGWRTCLTRMSSARDAMTTVVGARGAASPPRAVTRVSEGITRR